MEFQRVIIKLFIFVFVLMVAFINPLYSQNNPPTLFAKSDSLNNDFQQEKIYLHLDRPSYWAGDDIWFKIYLKNTAIPNCNVYVELLDSEEKVICKNIYWAINGFAYGDFELEKTLSSGMYRIRAYTSWMRNFDEQWFYNRDLIIWNLRDKNAEPEMHKLKAQEINVDFMPEGGTFIAGVNNRVAFKISDKNGNALEAEGVIIDKDRNRVAEIQTGFKGIGSFYINPQHGERYTAEMTISGSIPKSYKLPKAEERGVSMKYFVEDTSGICFEINEQPATLGSSYYLVGQSEGEICYEQKINVSAKAKITIDKNNFRTGIVRFTLFNNELIPQCERLVFVNHHDQINVTIAPNKASFKPREEVILNLMAQGKGKMPSISNLSVSVYPVKTTNESQAYPENIMTRFLLSSELKGKIEEPAYYFKDDSISTITALDNVMLTHGYRYFTWEEVMEDNHQEIIFQPDSSIEIKGKLVSIFNNIRPISDGKLTMMTTQSLLDVKVEKSDENGNFKFTNLYFYDSLHVSISGVNRRGRKFVSIIWDDKVQQSPNTHKSPSIYTYRKEKSTKTITYLGEMSPELINRKWRLSDTIILNEINVVARKREDDGNIRPYTSPDYAVDIKKMKDKRRDFEKLWHSSVAVRRMLNDDYTPKGRYFIDGVEDILGFGPPPIEFIDKIEYVHRYIYPDEALPKPAVFYWTIRGRPVFPEIDPIGIYNIDLQGYSLARRFYNPVYNGTEDPEEKAKDDYRNTLYWNPVVVTDAKGKSQISFYTSDQMSEVKIVVEGLTYDGKLCRGVNYINVGY